jgi:hypothetical protein
VPDYIPQHVSDSKLLDDIRRMIEETRSSVAIAVNTGLTLLHWRIGRRINDEILKGDRAEYGKQILATLSQELTVEYGKGFNYSALTRMVRFVEAFPQQEIVATLSQQLNWSHFVLLIPLKEPLQREFYAEMCRVERWSVRTMGRKSIPCFTRELLFHANLKIL